MSVTTIPSVPVQPPQPLLQVNRLQIDFISEGHTDTAVKDITFTVNRNEILGIAGESGSGKSVTSLAILQLLNTPPARYTSGEILFSADGHRPVNMIGLEQKALREIRGKQAAMIFQEPMTSLNPVFTCGHQVMEAVQLHAPLSRRQARQQTLELFEKVKLPRPAALFDKYPHQLSGGQKQRVMIAMAMSGNPSLLICDEPTTALDVTVQKAVLDLIRELQAQTGMGVIFITHDLGVLSEIAHRAIIMYRGSILEEGLLPGLFHRPKHPYTRALVASRPALYGRGSRLPVVDNFWDGTNTALTPSSGLSGTGHAMESGHDTATRLSGNEGPEGSSGLPPPAPSPSSSSFLSPPPSPGSAGPPSAHATEPSPEQAQQEPPARLLPASAKVEPLIRVENLSVWFPLRKSFTGKPLEYLHAIDQVSFEVYRGETLGLVGESGCGKTTLGRSLLRLTQPVSGSIFFEGMDLLACSRQEMKTLRQRIQIIFQDPYASLNPSLTVGEAIAEPLRVHRPHLSARQRKEKVVDLLEKVNLSSRHYSLYPHEFSGGQRQRIVIARALILHPSFVVCDESVSALDVSVQAQVLNLLNDLKKNLGFTIVFISHDLSVIRYMSDRVMVMHQGKIVESGPADELYAHPRSPYTRQLLEAIPGASAGDR